jgi:hypothetical protein
MWVKLGGRFLRRRKTWWRESLYCWWTEGNLLIVNVSGCFDCCREWISVLSRYTWALALCWWWVSHTYVWDACFGTSTPCDSRSHRMSEVPTMHCTALPCTLSSEIPAVLRHYLPSIPLCPRRHQLYWDITCHPFHPFFRDTSCTETLPVIHFTPSLETPVVLRHYLSSISPLLQRHQLYWDNKNLISQLFLIV